MSAYPSIVFVVSLAFCLAVARQYLQRRRPYQLVWTISLAAAAIGSLAYLVFLNDGKSEIAFRIYYIGGALLTAPLLGLGSILLIARSEAAQRRAWWVVGVVGALCVIGAVLLLVSSIDSVALHYVNGGPGDHPDVTVKGHPDVYRAGPWLAFLIVLNAFGAVAVIGVALYSGWKLLQRQISSRLVSANVLIAVGTIIISLAGTMARTDLGLGFFWITMAVGWVVLFGGFLLTFKLHRPVVAATSQGTSAIAGTRA